MRNKANSKDTRVRPVFNWFSKCGCLTWAQDLVNMAEGLNYRPICGAVIKVHYEKEWHVPASSIRLAWMMQHKSSLVLNNRRDIDELKARLADHTAVKVIINKLLSSIESVRLPPRYRLEGSTYADCLIECEKAIIWIEGKRFDRISFSTKWDKNRDQIARNLDALQRLAQKEGKDYCLIICHEHELDYREQNLVKGYRGGALLDGMPHLEEPVRRDLGLRIGMLTWQAISRKWKGIRLLPKLSDLDARDIGKKTLSRKKVML